MSGSRIDDSRVAVFRIAAFLWLPLAALAAAAVLGAACGTGWSERLGAWPWIVSLVLVGLPHGAADFAASRLSWQGATLAAVWLAYLAAMGAVAAGFLLAPRATIVAFAAVSCWHFGLAHVESASRTAGAMPRWLAAASRGCVVLALPLAVRPEATAAAAADLAALAVGSTAAADLFPAGSVRVAGLALAAVTVVAAAVEGLLAARRAQARRAWAGLVMELVVIAGLGLLTDPLFAVGSYFLLWHAWRQMEPLAGPLAGAAPRSWRELGPALARIHAAALPLLVPTWLAIGGVWWLSTAHTPRDVAIVSIAAYLVVTPAHELLGRVLCPPARTDGPVAIRRRSFEPRGVLAAGASVPAVRGVAAARVPQHV